MNNDLDIISQKLYGHNYDKISAWGQEHVRKVSKLGPETPIKESSATDHIAHLYAEIEKLNSKVSEMDDIIERLNEDYFNRES